MATPQNRILWWVLVASLLVYASLAYLVELPGGVDTQAGILVPIFAVLGVAIAAGSLVHRRRALSGPIRTGELDATTEEGRRRAFQPFVVNLALSESVGIYGLVLAFVTGNPDLALRFCSGALALMFLHRPTAPDLVPPMSGYHRGGDSRPIA